MSTAQETLISIDCGTQSLRIIIFGEDGTVLAKRQIIYKPYTSPREGWAEQDPEIWWNALCKGVADIKSKYPDLIANAKGLGVTAQRDTVIFLGKEGQILRPAITWLDTRKAYGPYKPNPLMKAIYSMAGVYEKIVHAQSNGQCNWVQENEPDTWINTWKVVMVSGFLQYRLTGMIADSPSSLVGHIPFDHKKQQWAGPGHITSKIFPIEHDKLCEVVESGKPIGKISNLAAELTGLPAGIPVIACGSDKACETLGMGCLSADVASLSFGTTASVEICTDRYIEPSRILPAYSAAVPKHWVPEIEIFRGYWMISWFKNELGYEERIKAIETGQIPEEIMDKLLDSSPPGCFGLMLQPYWGANLRNHYAKGAIIGFGDVHGRHAIYRAIIEGLAYSLREGLEQLEKRTGIPVKTIAVSGGAAQSNRICGITADILKRPLVRGVTTETSALGAAILTAFGTGLYPSIDKAVKDMVRTEHIFPPAPDHQALYDGLYKIYRQIYPALKNAYKQIQEVTGYPS